MSGCAFDRYDQYCTKFGCFSNVYKDDIENPPPSLALTGVTLYPDPRVPSNVKEALCGPYGCAGALPLWPASALQSIGCPSADAAPSIECRRSFLE